MKQNLFKEAIAFVLKNEGGYSNNPNDAGGETNYGISKKAYPYLDIKILTKDDAIKIYKEDYWSDMYEQINDKALAVKIFDLSINLGPKKAYSLLQEAINSIGHTNVQVDGKLGPKTVQAVNSEDPEFMMLVLRDVCNQFYLKLATQKKNCTFLIGWLTRLYKKT